MNVRDVCNWLLVASESEINAVRKACDVGIALNGTTQSQHVTEKRRAWSRKDERALKSVAWNELDYHEQVEIANGFGRTVSACNYKWNKLHGKWK